MKNQQDKDRDLVDFLNTHRPIPPLADAKQEEQLMQLITHTTQETTLGEGVGLLGRLHPRRFWVMGGAVAASVLLALGAVSLLSGNKVSPFLAQFNPQTLSESEQAELEEFMFNTWGIEGASPSSIASSWDNNWLVLANLETETTNY